MTKLKQEIDCPHCDGRAELIDDHQDIFYRCKSCGFQFTTTESDTVWLKRLKQKKEKK